MLAQTLRTRSRFARGAHRLSSAELSSLHLDLRRKQMATSMWGLMASFRFPRSPSTAQEYVLDSPPLNGIGNMYLIDNVLGCVEYQKWEEILLFVGALHTRSYT